MTNDQFRISCDDDTRVRVSRFDAGSARLEEIHLCIEAPSLGSFSEQLNGVERGYARALQQLSLDPASAIFRRVFLSDAANQSEYVEASATLGRNAAHTVALSIIEQPPLEGRRIVVWAYHVRAQAPLTKRTLPHGIALEHNGYSHLWCAGFSDASGHCAFDQTSTVLDAYSEELRASGASLAQHALRTWFYVYDIDSEYAGLVEARKRHFERVGLTKDTHYIASTGIAGRIATSEQRVMLDAYAVRGVDAKQISYLSAPRYLGPTHLYGVTFERGTKVTYGDRSHVFISGTASIDPSGQTLYIGDVRRQCERALENMEALLADGLTELSDVAQLTAYVRDPADGSVVEEYLKARCPNVPRVIVHAPVCRPNWLVEIECIAVVDNDDPTVLDF